MLLPIIETKVKQSPAIKAEEIKGALIDFKRLKCKCFLAITIATIELKETKEAANYNAKIDEQNARLIRTGARREAGIIRQNAVLNEYRQRKRLEYITGEQTGAYAARGVSVSTGSPLDVMAETIAAGELEIAIGQWNAENETAVSTYNAEVAARNKESEAKLRRRYGKSAATTATYQAAGTLLSTAGTYSTVGKARTIGGPKFEQIGSYTGVRKY